MPNWYERAKAISPATAPAPVPAASKPTSGAPQGGIDWFARASQRTPFQQRALQRREASLQPSPQEEAIQPAREFAAGMLPTPTFARNWYETVRGMAEGAVQAGIHTAGEAARFGGTLAREAGFRGAGPIIAERGGEAATQLAEEMGQDIPPGRAGAQRQAGRGIGQTITGFGLAKATIPMQLGKGLYDELRYYASGAPGREKYKPGAVEQPFTDFMTKEGRFGTEMWNLLAGVIPPVGAAATLSEELSAATTEDEAEAVLEQYLRAEAPATIAATGAIGASTVKGMRASRERARQRAKVVESLRTQAGAGVRRSLGEAQAAARAEAPMPAGPTPPENIPTAVPEVRDLPEGIELGRGDVPAAVATLPQSRPAPRVEPQIPGAGAAPEPRKAAPRAAPLPPQTAPLQGAETIIRTPAGDYRARYEVVPADEVIASHDAATFQRRADYPEGVQERPYHRDLAEQGKVAMNAQKFDPRFVVTNNPDATNGPPVLTSDSNVVLGGNSRAMTHARIAAGLGREGAVEDYMGELVSQARMFGIEPEAIEAMHRTGKVPMLVRRVEGVSASDIKASSEAGRRFNLRFTQDVEPVAAAVSRARNLPPEALGRIGEALAEAGEEVTLREALKSGPVQRRILQTLQEEGTIPSTEINRYVHAATGALNEAGVDLVERTLAGSVVPDADLLTVAPKAQVGKIVRAAPAIAQARLSGEAWDLGPRITEALALNARAESAGVRLEDYIDQRSLFGREDIPAETVAFAVALRDMKPTEFRRAAVRFAQDSAEAPQGQMGLGLTERPTPERSFAENFRIETQVPEAAMAAREPREQPYRPGQAANVVGSYTPRPLPMMPKRAEAEVGGLSPGEVVRQDFAARTQRQSETASWLKGVMGDLREPVELHIQGRRSLMVLMRDPSNPGKVRVQVFDEHGPSGHWTEETSSALASRLASEAGASQITLLKGELDKLTSTREWESGMERLERMAAEQRRLDARPQQQPYQPRAEVQASIPKKWATEGVPARDLSRIYREGDPAARDSADIFGLDEASRRVSNPERQALHDRIVEDYIARGERPPEGETPQLIMTAGGWGSGKSVTRKKLPMPKAVHADADAIKEEMPEYRSAESLPVRTLAMFVHEESSALSKRIAQEGIDRGFHTIYDSSGKGKAVTEMLQRGKEAGFETRVVYVETPLRIAYRNSYRRSLHSKRRLNPRDDLYRSHKEAAVAILKLIEDPNVDSLIVISNKGKFEEAEVAIRKERGKPVEVVKPEVLDDIRRKATLDVEAQAAADRAEDPIPPEHYGQQTVRGDGHPSVAERGRGQAGAPGAREVAEPARAPEAVTSEARRREPPGPSPAEPLPGQVNLFTGEVVPERPPGRPSAQIGLQFREPRQQTFSPSQPSYRPPRTSQERGQVKGRHQIIKELGERLNVPIRVGRFRVPGALAVFKIMPEVIRKRAAPDVSSVAHEAGHVLERPLFGRPLQTMSKREIDALVPGLHGELIRLAETVKQSTPSEGFAEYVRSFVDGSDTSKLAPILDPYVKRRLAAELPEAMDALGMAKEDWGRWNVASATAQVVSEIDFDPKTERSYDAHDFYRDTFDAIHPINVIETAMNQGRPLSPRESSYVATHVLQNWYGRAKMWLGDPWRPEKYRPSKFSNPLDPIPDSKSFYEVFRPIWNRAQRKNWSAYAVSRRGLEVIEQGKKTPWTKETYEQVIREQDSPQFRQVFEDAQAFNQHLRNYLLDGGGLDPARVDALVKMGREYVPYFRVIEGQKFAKYVLPDRPGNLAFKPIKSMKGSERVPLVDPVEGFMRNVLTTINWAERNAAMGHLIALAERHRGMGKYVERKPISMKAVRVQVAEVLKKAGLAEHLSEAELDAVSIFRPDLFRKEPNTLVYWREARRATKANPHGKPEVYEVHPDLFEAYMSLDRESSNWILRALAGPKRILTTGVTLALGFIQRNPARDQFTAFINSKYGYQFAVDFARGISHAVGRTDAWRDYEVSGAAYSTMASMTRPKAQEALAALMSPKWQRTVRIITNPLELLRLASHYGESPTRLMETKRALEAEGRSREGVQAAAYAGMEVTTNFKRIGARMTGIGHMAAFFTAQLAGLDRTARAFKDRPIPTTAKTLAAVTIPSLALWYANRDEDWYKERPQWEKDMYFHLGKVGDTILVWPKPHELGLLFGSLAERIAESVIAKDPEAFEGFGERLAANAPLPLPTGAIPLLENMANYQFFFGRPIVPEGEQDRPPRYQYGPFTSEAARRIGGILNVSPRMIENLIRGYSGGLGMSVARLGDIAAPERPTKPWLQAALPAFARPAVTQGAESVDRFYREYEQVRAAEEGAQFLEKEENEPEFERHMARSGQLVGLGRGYRRMAEMLSRMGQEMNRVRADRELTGEEKYEQIKALTAEKIAMVSEFNRDAALAREENLREMQAPPQRTAPAAAR